MSSANDSYLRVLPENQNLCLLCEKSLAKNNKDAQRITGESCWKTLISKAEQWSKINILLSDKYYCFENVFSKVCNVSEPFGRRHNTCRIDFSGKLERYLSSCSVVSYDEDHGMLEVDNSDNIPGITDSSINISATRFTRSSSEHIKSFTKLCFVCQEVRPCEENRYNQGGIGRCEQSSSASRIKESMKEPLKNGDAKFDIYSADIFYHQSCYRNFVREQKLKTVDGDSQDETNLMNDFFRFIRLNIIKNENAYLLTQLLSD